MPVKNNCVWVPHVIDRDQPLPPAEACRLAAAERWLELGNSVKAHVELGQIAPEFRAHPDALLLRWHTCREWQNWGECLEIARTLTEVLPDDSRGWLVLAKTFCHQKRYQDAYDLAVSNIASFPPCWELYYDAACYACLTGRLEAARDFLKLATATSEPSQVKLRGALDDPDLKPLWRERGTMGD